MINRILTIVTNRIHSLPVLVLMPHSSCNCRCVMCDIWKANSQKKEISVEELQKHIETFRKLKVREIALSGGEALMHSNLWKFCSLLHQHNIRITLLSTGLLLKHHASEILKHIDEVIVSLDGGKDIHNQIRNIPSAYEKLEEGVKILKKMKPNFRVKGRTVLQRQNFRDFQNIVQSAKTLGLDQISFLGADVSTEAFNRAEPWNDKRVSEVALTKEEVVEFRMILAKSFIDFKRDYETRFIAESPIKMMTIAQHYAGLLGLEEYPKKKCNAPWVSAVVESDGEVKPCFFHASYGNIFQQDFLSLINSTSAIDFRKKLNVKKNPVCQKCVCSLYLSPIKF